MGTNVVVIGGRLTRDAELKNLKGYSLLEFTIAFDKGWGQNKKAIFVDCKWWGKGAEALAQYMTKGKMVHVTGEWDREEWTGNNGIKNRKDLIDVKNVELGAGPQNGGAGADRPMETEPPMSAFDNDLDARLKREAEERAKNPYGKNPKKEDIAF